MFKYVAAFFILFFSNTLAYCEQIDGFNDIKFSMSEDDVRSYIKAHNYNNTFNVMSSVQPNWTDLYCLFNNIPQKQKNEIGGVFSKYYIKEYKKPLSFTDDNNRYVEVYFNNGKITVISVHIGSGMNQLDLLKLLSDKYGKMKQAPGGLTFYNTSGAGAIWVLGNFCIQYINVPVLNDFVNNGVMLGKQMDDANKRKATQGL